MQCSVGQFQGGESFLCGVVFRMQFSFLPNRNRCFRGTTHLGFLPNTLCFTVRSPPYSSSLHSIASSYLKSEEQQQGDEVLEEEEDDNDFGEEQQEGDEVLEEEEDDDDFGEGEEQEEGDELLEEEEDIISYLINSCGLSPQSAESASRSVYPLRKDNAKAVIDLLTSYGVSNAGVSRIIANYPRYLSSNPTVTLLPKLEFLCSIGASNSDMDVILSRNHDLLRRSLERSIIPFYNKLKSILISDEKVVKCLKRISWIVEYKFSRYIEDNSSMLREIGISQSVLSYLVVNYPSIMGFKPDAFSQKVHDVLDLGFDPSKYAFAHALLVFFQLSRETREEKLQLYRRWCFSEKEIWSAIKKNPIFLLHSQKKINNTLDFLVHKMGYQPSDVANAPMALGFSLEKRIIPRLSVIKALQLKGFINRNVKLSSVLRVPEEYFLGKFVFEYQEEAPELFSIFRGDMSIWELGYGLEETLRSKDL